MDVVTILLVVAYASLVLEITVFPIPSEASTFQLLFRADATDGDGTLSRARRRPTGVKLLLYFLPTAIGVALFLVPLLVSIAPAILDHLLPVPALQTEAVRWVGASLVVAGRLVTFVSVLQLRRARTCADEKLGVAGLFRYSRNPGLVGMFAFYIGLALLFPCWLLFAGFALYGLNMHQRVRMEESRLTAARGDAYRTYIARTPRYFGWPSTSRSEP